MEEEKVHTYPRGQEKRHLHSTFLNSTHLIPGQRQKLTSPPTPWVQLKQSIAQCQPTSL